LALFLALYLWFDSLDNLSQENPMQNVKKINDQISIAMTPLTPEDLQEAAQSGYKSVMNLRDPGEQGFIRYEGSQADIRGLEYVNLPVKPDQLNEELADRVMQQIDALPKPTLIHCKSGLRSGMMGLMNVAIHEGMSAEDAMQKGKKMGVDCEGKPQMKEFFQTYVSSHAKTS
jgi:uncharacterized protein (TIGR01244 family)